VYVSTSSSTEASPVAQLTDWSLNMTTDTQETTAFGATNKTYVQGLPDVSGDFKGFWNDADLIMAAAAKSSDGCKIYLYPSTDASTGAAGKYAYGPSWLNVSYATSVNGVVSSSGSFKANGNWYVGL
jgi:hypothetical protein